MTEHTWGVDIKTSLPDCENWANSNFHRQLAAGAPDYAAVVAAWKRQRRYIDWALEALGELPEVETNADCS